MPPNTDHTIRLKDGRTLGYAEYGAPGGRPVIHCHGTPSSRFEGSTARTQEILRRVGARVIVPDRPGFGLSDYQPGRTLLDWPDDVLELAGALGLGEFAVMGLSGGGPYALACAYKMPDRLVAAGIISGLGPLDAPGATEGMGSADRQLYDIARKYPWLLRPVFWYATRGLSKDPDKAIAGLLGELPAPDAAAMEQPEIREVLAKMVHGGFAQGTRGTAWEYRLFTRPWGFRLEEIRLPVTLWHGEADTMCPANMGRFMAAAIPDCRAKFFPGEGHISLIANHYEEMIGAIVC